MKRIRHTNQLVEAGFIKQEAINEIEKVVQKFSVSLTPHIVELLHTEGKQGPIAKQFLPSEAELNLTDNERSDPIGDNVYKTVKGIIHRYPDRCLLLPVTACPVYCRFCFRREQVGNNQALSKNELQEAYHYIEQRPEIWEVILSGGDPLILKPKNISDIMHALDKIEHVEVIRIHTRVPAVDPERVTEALVQTLKSTRKAVYVLLHANHASEFTKKVTAACARLVDAGIPMLSQTILLKGINDTPEIMGELMRTFVRHRIKPYYLHHADLALGTSHFRTTIQEGQDLMKALRGRYSGLCQPTYVVDIPGGFGKVPIGYPYIKTGETIKTDATGSNTASCTSHCYNIEDYQGQIHAYGSSE